MTTKPHSRILRAHYDPLGWAVVRAPLLPVEAYLALADRSSPAATRWQTRHGTLLPIDPWVRLAIVVGGGHLLGGLSEAPPDDPSARGKLLRYQIRMSTRPTPYGLFAGVALGEFGPATDLSIAATQPVVRARPDMGWLLSFIGNLEARPELFRQLRLVTHPAAFAAAGRVFLNDPTPLRDGLQAPITSVRATAAVQTALSRARGCVPYLQLAEELCCLHGANARKAEQLLAELGKQGLLLTDLRPPLTTSNPAEHVIHRLLSIPEPPAEAARLQAVLAALDDWARLGPSEAAVAWPKLEASLKALHPTENTPLEVDFALAMSTAVINRRVAHEAARAVELLLRLTPLPRGMTYLTGYRAAFESRYGHDREVPLLELLDPNFGLGPPGNQGGSGVDGQRLAVRSETLQAIALEALKERRLRVRLDDETLARLSTWDLSAETLPLSLDVCVFVIASSTAAVDAGEFLVALSPNVGGGQAGRYLGRFGDLIGSRANQALAEIARAEAVHAPRATWAELVYLPRHLRSANVVVRPAVRDHEIAIGVAPGVPLDRTIPLEELLVTVRGGRFRLRWPRKDTEVIVRASHMLNNFHAPGVCRFLDDIAEDSIAQLTGFDWGLAAAYPFLPRLESGRIVLAPAQWRISRTLRDAELPVAGASFRQHLAGFREHWNVPRYVYLTTGDNRLLLDLEAPEQADELRAELAKLGDLGALLLQEALPGPDHAWVKGPDGHYLAELIVPLVRRPPRESPPAELSTSSDNQKLTVSVASPLARARPPGSDWLFVKIYCPPVLVEELLVGSICDFCQEVCGAGVSNGWFYIRYSDPDPHIRIRFRGDPQRLITKLLPEVCSWCADLMADGLCQRFCFDTYDREIERYGGPAGMAAAEAIFTSDSPAAVDILGLLRATPNLDRLTATIISIDDLLAAAGLTEMQRLAWYAGRAKSRSFGGDDFRQRKTVFRAILGSPNGVKSLPGGELFARILTQRRLSLEPATTRLIQLEERAELTKSRETILHGVVHMHCNRLAGNDWGVEERALAVLLRTRRSLKEAPLAPENDLETR